MEKLQMSRMSKSGFIRNALYKTTVLSRFNEEELQSLRELRSLSNNINQIAKRVNQNQDFLTIVLELKKTKANIDSIIKTVFKI